MFLEIYLPDDVLDNEELACCYDSPKWSSLSIFRKTGIRSRRIAGDKLVSDLAVEAGERLFSAYSIPKDQVDFLVLCTQSPDFFLPATSCFVQDRLGLPLETGAFDFNMGCSGFIYGLSIAKGLLLSKSAKNLLLIMSETYSKFVHPLDKSTRTIFGDGAAAVLLNQEDAANIGEFVFGTDGSGAANLIVPAGGMACPRTGTTAKEETDSAGNVRSQNNIYMNGPEIFAFTLRLVPQLFRKTLHKNQLTMDDIDYFIFHQASRYILETLRDKLEIPEEKFCIDLEDTGNTVSATIPIALKRALDSGAVRKGSKVMLVGFGVGYSWGATVIRV